MVAAGALALIVGLGAAQAAGADPFGTIARAVGIEGQSLDDHALTDTVSPSGTTINLFDYWITERDADDSALGADSGYSDAIWGTTGINQGKQLQFTPGNTKQQANRYQAFNTWTGSAEPRYDMVKQELVNGYPSLQRNAGIGISRDESLAYLFDASNISGKKSYFGTSGLLRQIDGYYEYNSVNSFASFDEATNSFKVYDQGALYQNNNFKESAKGQFFPFYTAEQVFTEGQDGLEAKKIDTKGRNENKQRVIDPTNHYFGLSMSSRFLQPTGGKTNSDDDMVFEFSGDDDVWVFVDGVLVGDLGGNHSAASLKINFATGRVVINDGTDKEKSTTLRECFDGASVTPEWSDNGSGNTFADGTQHTLDFFYLERGNVDSNMRLKFNLVTIPVSEVYKVDQEGDPVADAHFALYAAEEGADGEWTKMGGAIADGRTDPTGQLLLTSKTTREILTFKDLAKEYGTNKFILTEDSAPAGYGSNLGQTNDSVYLEYVEIADKNSPTIKSGIVVDRGGTGANGLMWQNGAFTSTKETVTATDLITYIDGNGTVSEDDLKDGLLFAVVLKRDKTADGTPATDTWHAVYGDPLDGYEVQDGAGIDDVIAAAQADGANASILRLNSSGQYQTEIENLPGDITKYHFVLSDDKKDDAEYAVGFYFAKGVKSLDQANSNNTKRVDGNGFIREFSARVNVSNTFNRLYVQKDDGTVNADGTRNYIAGAEFALYADNKANITTGEDGKPALTSNAKAYDKVTTVKELTGEKLAKLKGAAVFPSSEKGVLENGTYYLKETKAPEGYKINDTLIKVIVSDEGVFADAGSEKDGVRTSVGVGRLMKTMAQFGAANEINSTLTYIKGSLQTATEADGKLTWGEASTDADKVLNLSYAANDALLEYGPAIEGDPVTVESETGWNRLLIQQDDVPAGATVAGNRTELGDRVLNALFSGSTSVIVSDEQVARLEVKKTVQKENGLLPNPDTKFEFQFDLPYDGGETYIARVFDKNGDPVMQDGKALEYKLSGSSKTISIKADQTIKVYGLKDNDKYTVTELTENGTKPAGFTLVGRKQGGVDYQKETPGADIKGTIAAIGTDEATPSANKLEFINEYKVAPVDLPAGATFGVKKILTTEPADRNWQDGDEFKINLTAKDNAPLPQGAKDGVYSVTLTKDQQKYTFGDSTSENSKITYTKSGIYEYTISEATGSKPGMTYSDAMYTVAVDVRDKGDGTLYVAKVTMKQTHADAENDESISEANPKTICEISWVDEDGNLLDEPQATPVDGKLVATITNSYTEKTQSVAIIPHKTFTNTSGSEYNFADAGFKAMLKAKAVDGNETNASEAPMPSGAPDNDGWITHEFSGGDQNATFGAIQFNSDEHMGHSYTYLVKEYIPEGVDENNILDGMQYDSSVYEVTYTVGKDLDSKGNLQVSVSWKKGEAEQQAPSGEDNLTVRPEFTNTYSVATVTVGSPKAQKTLKGRPWRRDDSFTFTLEAAQGTDTDGISNWDDFNKTVTLTGKDALTTNPVQFYFATEEKDGEQVPVQLTFTKAGTYTSNIKETTDGDAATNAQKKSLTLDGHTATVTYVVTDKDANGKHTGALTVTGPTYTNSGASTEDAAENEIAAFTNEYKATGNNGSGVNLTKVLHGKAMTNGMFSFAIEKVSADSPGNYPQSVTVDASKPSGDMWTKKNLLKLNFSQADLGKTYVYSVVENEVDGEHPGYDYDTKYQGTAYIYVTVKAKPNDEGKLYAEMVVVKGKDAKSDYTQDELANLQASEDLYVQRYDSSQSISEANKVATVPFENTYASSFDYTANGGLDLSKTFTSTTGTGSASSAFYFKVTPQNTTVPNDEGGTTTISTAKDAAGKLGLTENGSTFQVGPVSLGSTASTSVLPTGENNNVVFTQADAGKTYTYQVKEVTSDGKTSEDGTPAGYTYDKTVYTVTISVADNNDGTLTVTTTVTKPGENEGDNPVEVSKTVLTTGGATGDTQNKVATVPFENTYTTTPAAADLAVKKQISGRAETAKEFGFTLKATAGDATKGILSSIDAINGEDIVDKDGNKITLGADGVITSDAKTSGKIEESQPQEVKLTSLKFNKVGTYQFVVTENHVEDADDDAGNGIQNDGWTMDTTGRTVTVTVTDNGSQLVAKPSWGKAGDTFHNTYGATVAYSGINLSKTLTGKTLHAGDFEFEIKGVAGPADTGATADEANKKLTDADKKFGNDAPNNDGKATMNKLSGVSFDEKDAGKTFVYEVKETKGGSPDASADKPDGYTNDNRTYIVSIKVNDDSNGNLSTVTTVKVKDAEGEGKTYQNGAVADVPFENSYRSSGSLGGDASVKIEADKTLTGRDMKANEFTFEVTAKKDGGSAGVVTTGKNTAASNGNAGTITFGEIVYSNLAGDDKDFPKGAISLPDAATSGLATKGTTQDGKKDTYTFNYTVSEKTDGMPDGVTAEGQTSFDITVVVTDNNNGTLTAAVTYPTDTNKLHFKNKYEAAETTAQLKVTKNLTGRDWKEGDSFTFTLSPDLEDEDTKTAWDDGKIVLSGGANAKTEDKTISYDSKNPDAEKSATFGDITFKHAGTYQFYITEQAPEGATVSADKKTAYKDGVTYDLEGKVVTVEVVDNLNGTMTAKAVGGSSLDVTIENSYAWSGTAEATPQVQKKVTGRDSNTDFEFTLTAEKDYEDAVTVDGAQIGRTAQNAKVLGTGKDVIEDGTTSAAVNFPKLTFHKEGTYTFTVVEKTPASGWSCLTADQKITYEVYDNLKGGLDVKLVDNTVSPVTFENKYMNDGEAVLTLVGTKTIEGRDFKSGDTFEFAVSASPDGAPAVSGVTDGKLAINPTSGNSMSLNFGSVKFDESMLYKTFAYTFTETPGQLGGVTYDKATYTVTVAVEDNGQGGIQLKVTTTGDGVQVDKNNTSAVAVSKIDFENTYAPTGTVSATPQVTKTVIGRDSSTDFIFTLKATEDYGDKVQVDGENLGKAEKTATVTGANGEIKNGGNPVAPTEGNSFPELTFNAAGDYVFTISENETAAGWTCDTEPQNVTFKVTDNLNGGFDVAVDPAGAVNFQNEYKFTGESDPAVIQVTKDINGHEAPEGGFTFELVPSESDDFTKTHLSSIKGLGEGNKLTVTTTKALTVGANETLTFGGKNGITFTEPGDYVFTITETAESGSGWTNDNDPKTVTVHVVDDGDGTVSLGKTETGAQDIEGNNPTVTNTYATFGDSDEVAPKVTKMVTGGDTNGKKFSFELAPAEGQSVEHIKGLNADGSLTVTTDGNIEDGKTQELTFGNLKFDAEGEYKFTIKETTQTGDGWTCDNEPCELIVSVTDNDQGGLKAEIKSGDNPTITNSYAADGELDGAANLKVTKTIDGRNWIEGDTFEFVLTHNNDVTKQAILDKKVVLPSEGTEAKLNISAADVDDAGAHTKAFGNIKFTEEGEYEFKITETAGNIAGLTYDEVVRVVKVKVTDPDHNGNLQVKVVGGSSVNPTFTNTYGSQNETTASTDGLFTKSIKGRDWLDTDAFSFTLSAVTDGAPMPENTTVEVKAPTNATTAQSFGFGAIKFTWDDIKYVEPAADGSRSKTFEYEVAENDTSIPGITKDGKVATVKITVSDNGKGELTAGTPVVTVVANGAFVNTYTPEAASATLTANKTLSGRPLKDGEFEFQLLDADGTTVLQTKKNADGKVAFDPIPYDEVGVHDYTIKEVKGTLGGVTYDETAHKVHVSVTDDTANGKLVATVTYDDKAEVPTFENVYTAAPATDTPSVSKTVEPTAGNEFTVQDGQFSFTLKNTQNASSALDADQTITNAANSNAPFTALNFPVAGTYVYTLTEDEIDTAKTPGVSRDATVYTITYVVEDVDQNGKLTIISKTVTADGKEASSSTEGIAFTNTYDPTEATYSITGKKTIENVDPKTERVPADGEFTFKLTAVSDGAPMPGGSELDENGAMAKIVTNTGSTFDFGKMTYNQPGDYAYTVTEVAGNDPTIGYSTQSYQVIVKVSDEGGALTATSSVTIDAQQATDGVAFTNTYTLTPVTLQGEASLKGTKTLTGRDLNEGEFIFELKDANGDVLQTTTNGADGDFVFAEPITFDRVGTYTYTITENADSKLGGVTYDSKVVTATVTVSEDAAAHALKAAVAYSVEGQPVDGAAFENAYKATNPAHITFNASKVLEGRELKEGEFSFELREDGKALQTKGNAADGTVAFDAIEYTEVGEHDYEIAEVKGDDADVTYDETVFTYHVSVTDDLKGNLVATWTEGEAGAPKFVNTYTKPEEPVKPSEPGAPKDGSRLPGTGDRTPGAGSLAALAAAGAALVGTGVVLEKRRR